MQIEVKKLKRGEVELTIELSMDEYEPFLKQAAQKISENINIKGYRKGKADFEIIKKHVGEGEIWDKALDAAVQKTFVKALDKEKLVTVGSPKINVVKLAPGNPVIYKAIISSLPEVELADYKKIKIDDNKVEVKEDEIKKALENLQKMHAKETLVDREAKKNDKVEIDFDTFLDKIPVDNGKQNKFQLVLGENSFIPGFEEKIVGMKKDEEKQFELKFPKEYHQKNLANRMVAFKVKVNNVYNLELPELTDEFAKGLGSFKSADELKTKIKENLSAEQTQRATQQLEEKIIDSIIEKSKFADIPDILINSETKKMIDELEHNIGHQGMKFEDYLSHLKKSRKDLMLDFMPQAIKRVKSALIIREISKQEKINVTDQEVATEVEKSAAMHQGNEQAQTKLNEPAYKNYLKNIIASRKVIEHLKSKMVQ